MLFSTKVPRFFLINLPDFNFENTPIFKTTKFPRFVYQNTPDFSNFLGFRVRVPLNIGPCPSPTDRPAFSDQISGAPLVRVRAALANNKSLESTKVWNNLMKLLEHKYTDHEMDSIVDIV